MIHAPFGASSFYRWSACPGSIKHLEENPMPETAYAAEGTKAHDLAETMLTAEFINREAYEDEMWNHIRGYVIYCMELAKDCDEYAVEKQFKLEDDMFGTNDFSCWSEFDTLHIVDLKYGKGIDVQAEGNRQLMYYALGALENMDLDVAQVKLHIYQPRIENPIKTATVSMEEMIDFRRELYQARKYVLDNPDLKITGDHCRFCNKAKCPVMLEEVRSVLPVEDTLDLQAEGTAELVRMLSMEKRINEFFSDVRSLLTRQAENGEFKPEEHDMKLVRSHGRRRWKDGAKIPFRSLGIKKADAYESKLKSPAQLDKLIEKEKRHLLAELQETPETGVRLVGKEAKGEPVNSLEINDTLTLN